MKAPTKTCTKCGCSKPLEQFSKDSRHKDGRQSCCRLCHKKVGRERHATLEGKIAKTTSNATYRLTNIETIRLQKQAYKANGVAIINSYKCRPCADCHKTYSPDCMELDHIRGEKILNVSSMKSMSRDKLLQEIAKCEVVCAVCHRIRTEKNREPSKESRLLAHRAMVNQYKSKPCADCGESYPSVAMDLDHVKGEKVFEISNMGHYPRWKVLAELDKCEVVCANCHRIRTKNRRLSII